MTSSLTPNATYTLDTYRFEYPDISVVYEGFFEDSRDGIRADVTVSTSRFPKAGLLHQGTLRLLGSQSKATFVRALERRRGEGFLDEVDFDGIIAQTAALSYRHWKEGFPAVQLSSLEPQGANKWLLYPFLQDQAVCVLFGDGASGKSTLGEAMGVAISSGQPALGYVPLYTGGVLYLDWETEAETHREIVSAICNGLGIDIPGNIWYRRMHTSLAAGIQAIRVEAVTHEVTLVIVDSIGLAGGDEPERAGTKIALFNALRTLMGCTILCIDHVSHQDKSRPFGSIYTRNIARLAWAATRDRDEESQDLRVALRLEKINRGQAPPRQGFRIQYENNEDGLSAITFHKADPMDMPTIEKAAPLFNRVLHELRHGAMSVKDLATELDAKPNSILQTLRRNTRAFVKLDNDQWGQVT